METFQLHDRLLPISIFEREHTEKLPEIPKFLPNSIIPSLRVIIFDPHPIMPDP